MNSAKRAELPAEAGLSDLAELAPSHNLPKWTAAEDRAVNDNVRAWRRPRGHVLVGLAALGWVVVIAAVHIVRAAAGI